MRTAYALKEGIDPGRGALSEHVVKIPLHGFSVTGRTIVEGDVFMQVEDIFLAATYDLPGFRQIRHDIKLRVQRHQGIMRVVRHPEGLIPWRGLAIQLKAPRMDIGGKCHP